jgi:phospholipase C
MRNPRKWPAAIALSAMLGAQIATPLAYAGGEHDNATTTPIQHVIVLIGENRSLDHTFGTYQAQSGQTVSNLLAQGIINSNGTPGPNSANAAQFKVNTPLPAHYFVSTSNCLFALPADSGVKRRA